MQGRLRPDVSRGEAQAAFDVLTRRLEKEHPVNDAAHDHVAAYVRARRASLTDAVVALRQE